MNNQTTVTIGTERLDTETVRVDIKVSGAPADLFGAAFDLKVTGAEWKLKSYEAGDVFVSSAGPPLMLAVEKGTGSVDHKIVAGISLKKGTEIDEGDGRIMTFYLTLAGKGTAMGAAGGLEAGDAALAGAEDAGGSSTGGAAGSVPGMLKFGFENNILSALKNGERVDLKDVSWSETELKQLADSSRMPLAGSESLFLSSEQLTFDDSEGAVNLLQGDAAVYANQGFPKGFWDDPLVQVYVVLLVSLCLMLLLVGFLLLRKSGFGRRPAENQQNIRPLT